MRYRILFDCESKAVLSEDNIKEVLENGVLKDESIILLNPILINEVETNIKGLRL